MYTYDIYTFISILHSTNPSNSGIAFEASPNPADNLHFNSRVPADFNIKKPDFRTIAFTAPQDERYRNGISSYIIFTIAVHPASPETRDAPQNANEADFFPLNDFLYFEGRPPIVIHLTREFITIRIFYWQVVI